MEATWRWFEPPLSAAELGLRDWPEQVDSTIGDQAYCTTASRRPRILHRRERRQLAAKPGRET
jgi:hypothetical protein